MANFRLERLFILLDEPVPGLDHLAAVDPVEFAWHGSNMIAAQLGVTPLDDFIYGPADRPRWHAVDEVIPTVRALLHQYRAWLTAGENPYRYPEATLTKRVAVLTAVEGVLTSAASHDRRFYLAARDLG